tara:strand:- start:215 stop:877 length:663 start_codon:yes stop_codon:yes gene_type:complete
MAFRADEAAENGFQSAKNYLIPIEFSQSQRRKSEELLREIVEELGPVVESYPTWHPLVPQDNRRLPSTVPSGNSNYRGLDHSVYFVHGFITCPYQGAENVIESVEQISDNDAFISASRLEENFYSESACPVLVRCNWKHDIVCDKLVPKKIAVPRMIENELPHWRDAEVAEKWDTMRPYLLGKPHGSRSSLFVGQETALAMKKVYMSMVESGMFGPLMMD